MKATCKICKFVPISVKKNINTVIKGAKKERYVVNLLKEQGYYATRTPASKGLWDVWAINSDYIRLIQLKSIKKLINFENQFRHDLKKMISAKLPINTIQEFWVFINNQKYPLIYFYNKETNKFEQFELQVLIKPGRDLDEPKENKKKKS